MSAMPYPHGDDELRRRREEKELKDSWANFHAEIDRRLDDVRPKRSGRGEYDWREPVYAWARNHMPDESNIVRNTAKKEVDNREGQATKQGNKLLRDWMEGIAPLSWSLVGPKPVVVGKVRVRLDVATSEDIDTAARELLAAGTKTFAEVQQLAQALWDLGRAARSLGYDHVRDVGDLEPRHEDEPENFWEVDPNELDWDDDHEED